MKFENQLLIIIILSEFVSAGDQIIKIEESCPESCSCEVDHFKGYLTIQCTEIQSNFTFPSNIHLEPYLSRVNSIIASNNSIQSFSLNICDYPYLGSLDLSYNELTDIKYSYFDCKLNYLTTLILNNNNISSIDNNAFDNMLNLQTLNLESNQIDQIIPSLFFNLKNIKYIYLSKNLLKSIELWPIYILGITYLDLSYNQIAKFTNHFSWSLEDSFYLPGLFLKTSLKGDPSMMFLESTKINLQFNEIKSFDDEIIEQYGINSYNDYYLFMTKHFWAFDLNNNPIFCNCETSRRLLTYSLNLLTNDSNWSFSPIFQSVCSDPSSYRNQSIMSFDYCPISIDYSQTMNETKLLEILLESEIINHENNSLSSTTFSSQDTDFNFTTTEPIDSIVTPQTLGY